MELMTPMTSVSHAGSMLPTGDYLDKLNVSTHTLKGIEQNDENGNRKLFPTLSDAHKAFTDRVFSTRNGPPHGYSENGEHEEETFTKSSTDLTSSGVPESLANSLYKDCPPGGDDSDSDQDDCTPGGDSDILERTCRHCGKVCPKPSDIKRHMMVHTGERPFTCEVSASRE